MINSMKKIGIATVVSLPLLGFSMQAPEYLSVSNFKECLTTQKIGMMQQWCLPDNKPQHCPEESWNKLNNLALYKCSTPNNAYNY